TQLPTAESNIATIQATDVSVALNGATFHFSTHNVADVKITAVKNTAFIDASKLTFPLTIRPWKQGDYFYPFGMGMKKKKLKKFFIDEKIPLNEKEQISVIESNGKIVWVAGHRLDERFKVTDKTKQVFRIDLK
ncbi:MAG TPA: tRNA lysidine(34) synthetase TilS, partial [Chitinophagales bacterium]|nr:tRNA lysidine(34) synthetase TilS [Chitinophagales bacterium]